MALLWMGQSAQFDPKYKDAVELAAGRAAEEAVSDLTHAYKGRLLVVPLVGDQEGVVTGSLEKALFGAGKFLPLEKTVWQKIKELLSQPRVVEEVSNLDMAAKTGAAYDAEYVLFGKTSIDARFPRERVGVRLDFRIIDVKSKRGVFIGTYRNEERGTLFSSAYWKVKMSETSAIWRILAWSVLTLALPFVVVAFKEALGSSRPLLPVLLVVAFTGTDVFAAFALIGFDIDTVVKAVIFVAAMAASLFWNLFALSKVAELAKNGS